MLEHLGKLLAKGYGLLLGAAAGGLVGANFLGLIAGAVELATAGQRAPDPEAYRPWVHGGWYGGAGLFLAAGIAHMVRKARKGSGQHEDPPKEGKARSTRWKQGRRRQSNNSSRFRVTVDGKECGILGAIGIGSIGGALLGLMLGGSLLLFWFSLTYSPFAPEDWIASLSVEKQRVDGSSHTRSVTTTDHPVAMYLFFGPIVLGAIAVGLFSGVGTTIQKLKDARRAEYPSEH